MQHAAPDGHIRGEVGEVGRALPPQADPGDAEDGGAVEGEVAFVAPERHVLAQGVLDFRVGQDGVAGIVFGGAEAAEGVVGGPGVRGGGVRVEAFYQEHGGRFRYGMQ